MKSNTLFQKIFLAAFILIAPCSIYISCTNCHFDDPPNYFDITSASAFAYSDKGFGRTDTLFTSKSISRYDLTGIHINFGVKYIVEHSFKFANALLACEPPSPGTLGAKTEKIKSLEVISMFDFDTKVHRGDLLNSYLVEENESLSIADYIALDKNIPYTDINFKFNQFPDSLSDTLQFKIGLTLNNGEMYEMLTDEFHVR